MIIQLNYLIFVLINIYIHLKVKINNNLEIPGKFNCVDKT